MLIHYMFFSISIPKIFGLAYFFFEKAKHILATYNKFKKYINTHVIILVDCDRQFKHINSINAMAMGRTYFFVKKLFCEHDSNEV